jgi:glycerol kinase
MEADSGIKVRELRVDGGAATNEFLMQFQSDMLGAPIAVSDIEEASALGSALAGGLGSGVWKTLEELEDLYTCKSKVSPDMDKSRQEELYAGWKRAINLILTR